MIVLCTTQKEYMILTKGFKETLWLKEIIEESNIVQDCVTIHCDNVKLRY